jgi:peptidoglycan/LPS O-acetylase OafA/YrhL
MFGTYRSFLALMVVALHLGGVPAIGAYAVFGFYCLSGYLMTLIMQTSYGYTASGIGRYAVNRFLRIYPIYWVSILLSLVLVLYLGKEYTSAYHVSIYLPGNLSELLNNVLLFFPFRESPRLTPPAWALTVEIFFYIIIGLGASKAKRMTLIWFVLSVVYHIFAVFRQLGWEHRYFTIFAASLPFSTGALLFHYKEELTQLVDRAAGRACSVLPHILMLLILFNWYLGYKVGHSRGLFFYSNFVLCSVMVAVLLSRKSLPLISKKLDKWLGDFSYPIYLIHYQVGIVVIVLFSALGVEIKRPEMTLMFVSIPLIFVLSLLITVTLERPIEIIRSKVKR